LSLKRTVFQIFDFESCRNLKIRVKGHSRSLKVVPLDRLNMVSYYCSLVSLSLKGTVLQYSTCRYTVTLKPGLGSLKVIKNDTNRSSTYNFLLTFHSNRRPILHRFRGKWRYPLKIANFSQPGVFCALTEGDTVGIGYRRMGQKKLE